MARVHHGHTTKRDCGVHTRSPGTGKPASRRTGVRHMSESLYGGVQNRRVTIRDLQLAKPAGERWAMLTAYDYSTARVFDDAGIPVLLVGDSAANVVYGYDSTVPVDDRRTGATGPRRRARRHARPRRRRPALRQLPVLAGPGARVGRDRFMKDGGAQAVKLEGGAAGRPPGRGAASRRHPGHGPHRPDPAVGQRARRLPRPGPRRRGRPPPPAGRQGAAARRRVRRRARGRAERGRGRR